MMIRTVCILLALATSAAAQTVSPGLEHANPEMNAPAQREVQQRVEEFLKKLGSRDVAGVRALLAPKALIAVVRQQRDGTFANTYQTGEEFLAQFEKNAGQPKFEEPIANVMVTIDSGRLAYVRADFTVVRDGKVVSSGVDHFTWLKDDGGWKLAVVAYTSLPAQP
jgi:ketosteroid isomerase-like protein